MAGRCLFFTYSGSDTSEHGESPNETENVNTSREEPRQGSNIGTIAYRNDQTIEGYPFPDELRYHSDGYISKTYDPDMYTKRCMARGAIIITVNEADWEGLLHHEHILWGRLGCIERVKGTSPRFIERVLPEANKAIEKAECEIELADEMDLITFYSTALSLLLWVREGHSGPNRDMVHQVTPTDEGQDQDNAPIPICR